MTKINIIDKQYHKCQWNLLNEIILGLQLIPSVFDQSLATATVQILFLPYKNLLAQIEHLKKLLVFITFCIDPSQN